MPCAVPRRKRPGSSSSGASRIRDWLRRWKRGCSSRRNNRTKHPSNQGDRGASAPGDTMQFRAQEYYQVSLERMRQARATYREGAAFALAMYCGGLAVECLLRAFRWSEDATFEGRHVLAELLEA